MKRITFLIFVFLIITWPSNSQIPNRLKYQTIVRDGNGEIITNQQITITINILQGSESGTIVCSETFTPITNDFGLVNLQIGSIDSTAFSTIDWANGPYFNQIELEGNTMGTSQLLSVPYALFAERTNLNYQAGDGIQIEDNVISANINLNTSSTGDTLFLVPGNFVIIPGISSANNYNAVVTTNIISSVTPNSAVCSYTVILYGGPEITERGVCWDTDINPTIEDYHTNDGNGAGTFYSSIIDLTPNTTYFVRAYATNSIGTTYGEQKNFTTEGTLPTVITGGVVGILPVSAIVLGNIYSGGSSPVFERGVCYGLSPDPTIFDNKITSGSGTGSFNVTITKLVPNTPYYARAYGTNSFGTSYGDNQLFTTTNAFYEGFESGFPSGWTGSWTVTSNPYEGYYSLYSTSNNDIVNFTYTFSMPGQISFYYVGGGNGYNQFCSSSFYIDDILIGTYGNNNWTQHSATFTSGTHTFKWKNVGGGNGCANIDYIICTEQ